MSMVEGSSWADEMQSRERVEKVASVANANVDWEITVVVAEAYAAAVELGKVS